MESLTKEEALEAAACFDLRVRLNEGRESIIDKLRRRGVTTSDLVQCEIISYDFISTLPAELQIDILMRLDEEALVGLCSQSRQWRELCRREPIAGRLEELKQKVYKQRIARDYEDRWKRYPRKYLPEAEEEQLQLKVFTLKNYKAAYAAIDESLNGLIKKTLRKQKFHASNWHIDSHQWYRQRYEVSKLWDEGHIPVYAVNNGSILVFRPTFNEIRTVQEALDMSLEELLNYIVDPAIKFVDEKQ